MKHFRGAAQIVATSLLFLSAVISNGFGSVKSSISQIDDVVAVSGATLKVTSTANSGPGTLRQALLNAQSGDTITFDSTVFPPSAPVIISVTSELPHINQGNVTIDASNAGVILDGSNVVSGEYITGLTVISEGSTIQGLQIENFPGAGIVLAGGAKHNIIGGDRGIGSGPIGQGNLIAKDANGVGLWGDGTSLNTVMGNIIGTDITETIDWGNNGSGIVISEGASNNTIGPNNVVAYNSVHGVEILPNTIGNTITQNSIYKNIGAGINSSQGTNPIITQFDLETGTVSGATCANCTVEVFSTADDQGDMYEGQAVADKVGYFSLDAGGAFVGPHLTTTATDDAGTTSAFSFPTSGERQEVDLQQGNTNPKLLFQTHPGSAITDNKIGPMISLGASFDSVQTAQGWMRFMDENGFTWVRLSLDCFDWSEVVEGMCGYSRAHIDGVDPIHDQWITDLSERDITIYYGLVFWDEDIVDPGTTGYSRFKTQDEIDRYLNYASFIADHFKGRIQYYEILNETFFGENSDFTQQNIALDDYINLVHQVIPVIKAADPDAKVIAGPAPGLFEQATYDYQLEILSSDLIMPEADAVSWHPGSYPLKLGGPITYLYEVPKTVDEIRSVASAHGFTGEYILDEMGWPTAYNPSPSTPWFMYSEKVAAKYYGRGIIDHRGMGLTVIVAGTATEGNLPKMDVIRNLATLLDGAEPITLSVEVESNVDDIQQYAFSLPGDNYMIALWQNKFASEEDLGVSVTVTLPGLAEYEAKGIDVLYRFQQKMTTQVDNSDLVIQNLRVKDYPLILLVSASKNVYLPAVFLEQ